MCIIYHKPKGVVIPYELKFKPSVLNNPHGYGISVVDKDNMLLTLRAVPDKPDPETLYRLITEELDNEDMLIHLRYNTVGRTTLRNCHPFPILERGEDGVDIRMAHNGTIANFRPPNGSPHSDTRMFVSEVVRPLFKRLCDSYDDPSDALNDPMIYKILSSMIPTSSVLCFLAGDGQSLKVHPVGNGGGEQEEGYWASNVYSFRANYRTPASTYTTYDKGPTAEYAQGHTAWGEDYYDWWTEQDAKRASKQTTSIAGYPTASAPIYDKPKTVVEVKTPIPPIPPLKDFAKDATVELFTKKYGLTNIEEVFDFGDDLIELLKDEDDLVLLVKELILEMHQAKRTIAVLAERNRDLEKTDAQAA